MRKKTQQVLGGAPFTCHKVSKTNRSQGDDDKVKGLQRRPALDVFEDGCWKSHEQQAAEENKQQRGDDPNLCLTDVPALRGRNNNTGFYFEK